MLKKLSRAELLELLVEETAEVERLKEELDKKNAALEDRRIKTQNAGDIAHAALSLNRVMEAAQNAADQYLENIRMLEEETRMKCELLYLEAEKNARADKTKNNGQV